ncbi:hypothetical protein HY407_03685 [Candidatus Gottesmanbacteria bacterium]|nr:hypothetical protein [Candidatus Gottesmanbacteria bacterium]
MTQPLETGRFDLEAMQARTVRLGERRSGGFPTYAGGDRQVAQRVLGPLLRENDSTFESRIKSLLDQKGEFGTNPEKIRDSSLDQIYNMSLAAASYGYGKKFFGIGRDEINPVRLPPITSRKLIDVGIVVGEQAKAQIEARESQLTERYGQKTEQEGEDGIVPAENWIIVKAFSEDELNEFIDGQTQEVSSSTDYAHLKAKLDQRPKGENPIFIQEHYSITLPEDSLFDVDVVGNYIIFKTPDGVQLYFLGEYHSQPHYHQYDQARGNWETVPFESFGKELSQEINSISLPQPEQPYDQYETPNEHVAKLLAFFRYSAKPL